jgi:quercetin dioxygenase-like cupin family protein
MARVIPADALPRWRSTRDGRDRLDLVTEAVGIGAGVLQADRVVYHPGDTAARHYHLGCDHAFYVLEGAGLMHVGDETHRLTAGMVAAVRPGEVHWFENDTDANFSFVEFWVPPPEQTVWVADDT